jgi:glycine cleavage system regulatory protein
MRKNLLLVLLASAVTPFRLYAVEPAKEPTLVEKLNAWLKDKEQLTVDLNAATARATTAESALATVKTEAQTAATAAAASLTEATGKLTAAESKVTAAESQVSGLKSQVSAFESLLSAIGFKPAADSKPEAFLAAWNAHIANGVTQKMAELGVKAEKLPAATTAAEAETEEDLNAQLAAAKTPAEKGEIASKLNAIRDARWGKSTGKN